MNDNRFRSRHARSSLLFLPALFLSLVLDLQEGQEAAAQDQQAAQTADTPEAPAPQPEPAVVGRFIAIGGGGTTDVLRAEIKRLIGKSSFNVVILPQASSTEGRGQASLEMWQQAGANRAVNLDPLEKRVAVKELGKADLIWFPGGSQSRLLEALQAADLTGVIRRRAGEGVLIGGTSAGAAALGELMIAGAPDPHAPRAGCDESKRRPGPLPRRDHRPALHPTWTSGQAANRGLGSPAHAGHRDR